MFQEEFNSIINNPGNIMDIPLADVKGISERYPYCQAAQVIYAKKLRELNSPLFEQQLKKAAVAVYDRNALFQYIERTVTPLAPEPPVIRQNTVAETLADTANFVEEKLAVTETPQPLEEANPIVKDEPIVMEINQIIETTETIDQPLEDAFEEPVQEIALEEPVVVIENIETTSKQPALDDTEQVLAAILETTPELQSDTLPETDIQENTELVETGDEILIPDETQLTDELVEQIITAGELPEETAITDDDMMDAGSEELIFDMPGYDIEKELGTLAEEEMIKIRIQKPVEEQVNEEAFEDSFIGWLNRLGSPSKGKVVEMKAANLPVRKYLQTSPVAGISAEESRQAKVVDEIIAGELARKSLQADDKLVTETYARILTMQGKYQKAVDMYMKLSLLKPQKSDYFAALIDQLKKRIK